MAGKTYVTKGYSTYTNIPVPQHGYDHGAKNPDFVGSPSKAELLKEYVHAPSMSKTPKYALDYDNSSPPKYHGQDGLKKAQNQSSWPVKTSDFSNKEKYRPLSLVDGYPSEDPRLTYSKPDLEGTRHVRTGNISSSNKSWQGAGPPATHHPLTGPTNNINEALGFLEESVYYSPRADPRRRGVLDDLSTRAQPIEPLRRYARPAFVANSNEGMRRYRFET